MTPFYLEVTRIIEQDKARYFEEKFEKLLRAGKNEEVSVVMTERKLKIIKIFGLKVIKRNEFDVENKKVVSFDLFDFIPLFAIKSILDNDKSICKREICLFGFRIIKLVY
jgi:hypothetical protein